VTRRELLFFDAVLGADNFIGDGIAPLRYPIPKPSERGRDRRRLEPDGRDIVISSRPLEATAFQVENIRIAYVFYESGLSKRC